MAGKKSKGKDAGCLKAIEEVFRKNYKTGAIKVEVLASELDAAGAKHGVANHYDIVYYYRHRAKAIPPFLAQKCPAGHHWVIRSVKKGTYQFEATPDTHQASFLPRTDMVETKVLNATPEIIAKWAKGDEQAALAIVRYNRLIDVFTGITAYSLQNHLKTEAEGLGLVEVDELYLGVDSEGRHYAIPVEAKSKNESLSGLQMSQSMGLCRKLFPELKVRSIGVKLTKREGKGKDTYTVVAMLEFAVDPETNTLGVRAEKHYRLASRGELSAEELIKINGLGVIAPAGGA